MDNILIQFLQMFADVYIECLLSLFTWQNKFLIILELRAMLGMSSWNCC